MSHDEDYEKQYRGARLIYATQIGIDTNDEEELNFLIPIADSALSTVPDDFELGFTESDYPYFYNKITGESQWTHPHEDTYKEYVEAGKVQLKQSRSQSNYHNNITNTNKNKSNSNISSKYNTRIYRSNNKYDDDSPDKKVNVYITGRKNRNQYSDDDDDDDDDNDDGDEEEERNNPLLRALTAGIDNTKHSKEDSTFTIISKNENVQDTYYYDHPETNGSDIEREYDFVAEVNFDNLAGCFASYLGIDLDMESYLLSYVKDAMQDLPEGWQIADTDGVPYYFTDTESSWYHPNEASIRRMLEIERERWTQELKAQALGVVSANSSKNRKIVVVDSGSDDDTPQRPNNTKSGGRIDNAQKSTPSNKNNNSINNNYNNNELSTPSNRYISSTYSSPYTESDVSPDKSPIVRAVGNRGAIAARPTDEVKTAGHETNQSTSTTRSGKASEVCNDIEASSYPGDKEEDWILVSSPRNMTDNAAGLQATKVNDGTNSQSKGGNLAAIAFGKFSNNPHSPKTPGSAVSSTSSQSQFATTATSPPSIATAALVASVPPQPKTPPPVQIPSVVATRLLTDSISTSPILSGSQPSASMIVTPINANITSTTSFKSLILTELQEAELSQEEAELCFQFLHDMYYRKKEVFAELSEEEFKSVLDDPSSCKLKPGLKTNLKALHRKYRKEYINSPKFVKQNKQFSSNSSNSSNDSSSISNNSSSDGISSSTSNDASKAIDMLYEDVKANIANSTTSTLLLDDSNGKVIDSKQLELRKRIMMRRSSSSNQVGAGSSVDGAQSVVGSRRSTMANTHDYDPNLVENLKKREGDNQVLMEQMRELGIQPLQFIPLADIRREMDELMGKLNRGEAFDDNRFDYLLRCMNINQEYKREKEEEALKWKNEVEPVFNQWYLDMTAFMPSNIKDISISNLINYGYSKALATRLITKECLWLIRMGKQHIAKVHIADLRGKYNYESQKLDIVELAAIFRALPDAFESDGNAGVKSKWKAGLEAKLKAAYVQYVNKTLSKDLIRHPAYQNQVGKLTAEQSVIHIESLNKSSTNSDIASGIKENAPPPMIDVVDVKVAQGAKKTKPLPAAGGNMLAGLQLGLKALKKRDDNAESSRLDSSSSSSSSTSSTSSTSDAIGKSKGAMIGDAKPKIDIFAEIKLGAGKLKKSQDKQCNETISSRDNSSSSSSSGASSESSEPQVARPARPKGGPFGGSGLSLMDELKNNRKFKSIESLKSP